MKRYLRWIVAAEFLFAAGNLHAVEVEVPGLLTDHTVSSIGHDFYRAFSDKWESDYTGNLTINERPSAQMCIRDRFRADLLLHTAVQHLSVLLVLLF